MGYKYRYYDAAGNGPFEVETDTFEELDRFVQSGIGVTKSGEPVAPERSAEYIVDTETGDTVADGKAPDGVLLPGDAAYEEPEDDDVDPAQPASATGSQDVQQGADVGVQDPARAGIDPAAGPFTPAVESNADAATSEDSAGVPAAPVNSATEGSTPVYDQVEQSTGVVPSGPTPAPSDASSTVAGPSSDGFPSPAPATSEATEEDGPEGDVAGSTVEAPSIGRPVGADADADGTDDADSVSAEEEAASFEDDDDLPPADDVTAAQLDEDDDLSSFDTPQEAAPRTEAQPF